MASCERYFNTAGPIHAELHYHLSPLERLDLEHVLALMGQQKYFVLHAPRQTGKTSALLALRGRLNAGSDYRCVYVNVEGAQAAREDVGAAVRTVLSALARAERLALGTRFLAGAWLEILEKSGPQDALQEALCLWAEAESKPLVLLIDEIDALVGDSLVSVLRQLRSGYDLRPRGFPQSVVLCGVRDVRDYRIHASSEKEVVTGGSAFNIKAESLRLGDFSAAETEALLGQHTEATGQAFSTDAQRTLWELTQGQPWLVNALAYETCFRDKAGREHSRPVTAAAIQAAREALIVRRETHLDQLTDKLWEERVRRVIEPLLDGAEDAASIPADDLQYVRDLGLVRQDGPAEIANPIYHEVIPRDLTYTTQMMTFGHHDPAWYVGADGRLCVDKLLAAFQQFFREHSEHWVERFEYREAGPQLLLQAFLQRIVNSGGRIEREYGLGRMRTDLLILWPAAGEGESEGGGPAQRIVIECKVLRGSLERTLEAGLAQTRAYMDRCAADEGHLVVFDRTPDKTWEAKVFRRSSGADGAGIAIWGM